MFLRRLTAWLPYRSDCWRRSAHAQRFPPVTVFNHSLNLSPRIPGGLSLRTPGLSPRIPGLSSRTPGLSPRIPGLALSSPGLSPRIPGGLSLSTPRLSPRIPGLSPRIPGLSPRIPGGLSLRTPGLSPRTPGGLSPRTPGLSPRIPGGLSLSTPRLSPRIPGLSPRIPGGLLSLSLSERFPRSRTFHLSSALMENRSKEPREPPPRGGREPPHKRRRSHEERGGPAGDRSSKPKPPPPTPPRQASGAAAVAANDHGSRCFQSGRPGREQGPPPPPPDPPPQKPPGATPPPQAPPTPWTPALYREWEELSGPRPQQQRGGGRPFDFSVLSYNVLSQELLHDNAYLYQHCPAPVLIWAFRLSNLLREMEHYDADILCLQEVQQNHYEEQIRPALEARGYQCEYKRRTGRKPDGCAVAFRRSRFSLLSRHPLEFLRPAASLLDRDNVALVLLLRPRGSSPSFPPPQTPPLCVANTHLLYNPRRGDVKLAQLALLLAEVGRVSALPDGSSCPALLCGDLNSTPWSPLYAFLRMGRLDYQGMPTARVSGQEESSRGQRVLTVPIWPPSLGVSQRCQYQSQPTDVDERISSLSVQDQPAQTTVQTLSPRIEHSLRLSSAYSHLLRHDGKPEITTCHSRTAITVDYILYTPGPGDTEYNRDAAPPGGRGLQLLGRLGLVGLSELMEVNGLPNQHHSSDHLPLLARFRLCPGP